MASKVLLSAILLVSVGVCHGDHHADYSQSKPTSAEGDVEHVCNGECPEYELLCSTPEYDVRRYKSALWVSTTVPHLSLSQASARGRKLLHDYFGGANDKHLKMSHTSPMVTQTREPSESPVREITVSLLLPKKVAKNPPKPTDPWVVIDLVPETIMYVKKFGGRSPRVGFVADREAHNFFKTLKANKEPHPGEDGYYYVAQYGSEDSSDHDMHNEIWVFALNERTYKWLEFNDLTAEGEGLPQCLHGNEEPMTWEKMEQSHIPLLTRERCSTTYCQAPKKCPKYELSEVKGVDDESIHLKQYKDFRALAYIPPTCYYDTAIHASAGPLLKSLDNAGVPASDVAGTITVAIEKREELDGKSSCQKLYKVWYVAGGGTGSQEDLKLLENENGFQTPKTIEALHHGRAAKSPTFYTKCFGGNAYYEPITITSTAKLLMERLRDQKKCFLGDHISVGEYHPQSRLFDRFNEITIDRDPDCSEQEGRPPFTFHLPVSKDYSRTEPRPSLGHQCDTHECPETTTIMGLENNLQIFEYTSANWFYSKSPSKSCTNEEAFHKALNPLLSYLNGKNENNSRIDMTRPLYGKVNLFEQRCEKLTTLSTMVPDKFEENTPKPIDDTVSFQRFEEESWFFRSFYKGKYESGELERHLNNLIDVLENLKPFGVGYNAQDIWLATYQDPGEEEGLFEYVIEVVKLHKEDKDDDTSEETEEGKDRTDDAPDGKVALPKPEGCSESVCPTVYVTKNHSNFMELLLPARRSVCYRAKLCGDPYPFGRQLSMPLVKYFYGDNSDNQTITDFAVPFYKARVYSDEEGPCDRDFEICSRLPEEYEGKELPKPTGEGVATFTTDDGLHVYATAVKGPFLVSEETQKLMKTLDKENVEYDKTWVGFFSYDKPFGDPQERITFFTLVKPRQVQQEGEANDAKDEE